MTAHGDFYFPPWVYQNGFFHFARRQGRKDVGAGDARAFQMEGARLGHPSYTYTPASYPKIPPKNKRFLRVFFGYFRVRCRGMCVGWVAQNQVKNSVKLCENCAAHWPNRAIFCKICEKLIYSRFYKVNF